MTAPTEAKAPCPLAVMNQAVAALDIHGESAHVELGEARAKVAELVAADREWDSVRDCSDSGDMSTPEWYDKWKAAASRRRAALAAFSEVQP